MRTVRVVQPEPAAALPPTPEPDDGKSTTCGHPALFKTVLFKSKSDQDAAERHFQLPYPAGAKKLECLAYGSDPAIVAKIRISHLTIDDKYQARDGLDSDHLQQLRESGHLDPIEVFVLADGRLVVTDGRHRLRIAEDAGSQTVHAILWRGTDVEAQLRALEVNTRHGKALSLDERRKAVRRFLGLWDISDVEIAAKLGLHARTVKKIRDGMAAESSVAPTPAIRTDKNGHTRVVTGKKRSPTQSHTPPAPSKPTPPAKPSQQVTTDEHLEREANPGLLRATHIVNAAMGAMFGPEPATVSAYDQAIELVKSACQTMQGQTVDEINSFVTFTTLKLNELEPTNV